MTRKTKFSGLAIALLFTMTLSAGAWPVPDTGQTQCYTYDVNGDTWNETPCPAPGEPYYGQDGSYRINEPSFTKLDAQGNDLPDSAESWVMVRDNVTGLIWEIKQNKDTIEDHSNPHDADNYYTWYDSNPHTNGGNAGTPDEYGRDTEGFINALNETEFGGFSDWRLPTVKELQSIANYDEINPCIDTTYFPDSQSSDYWSSTADADSTDLAWLVHFGNGSVHSYYKAYSFHVRAVRGGQSGASDNLVINGDGTVTDPNTGLMWQQSSASETKTWATALSYCEDLNLADYTDWRLPNIKELDSIVDFTRHSPSIDTVHFPYSHSGFCWSSTTRAGRSQDAYFVDFSDGSVGSLPKLESYHVRAVRGGQNRLLDDLFVSAPTQGSRWKIEEVMSIAWDTRNLGGEVSIALSRDGGKTYETIVEEAPNNGSFDWTVTGPMSVNCMIEIVPLEDPSTKTIQGLFSINPILFTLTYTSGPNGFITGDTIQVVESNSDGTSVEAVPHSGFHFFRWSDGVQTASRADTNVTGDISVTAVFRKLGDVNADGEIDPADAILALQVVSGVPMSDEVHSDVDIDGDGRIGLNEALFALQVFSQIRDIELVELDSFTNPLGMTFNLISADTFLMGSPKDEPERNTPETQHQVTLTNSYYMQTTEVTQGQWKAVMGSNPSHFSNCGNECPVENVSWNDIQDFITELNKRGVGTYRLPTEAEWEFAARAGTIEPFNTGNCLSTDQANYDGENPYTGCPSGVYRGRTVPVASFEPNAWGLYDMHGNVWEWVQDWYGNYPKSAVTDPTGPSSGSYRVLRGGSWYNSAGYCRSANRESRYPDYRYNNYGFRLVLPEVP